MGVYFCPHRCIYFRQQHPENYTWPWWNNIQYLHWVFPWKWGTLLLCSARDCQSCQGSSTLWFSPCGLLRRPTRSQVHHQGHTLLRSCAWSDHWGANRSFSTSLITQFWVLLILLTVCVHNLSMLTFATIAMSICTVLLQCWCKEPCML